MVAAVGSFADARAAGGEWLLRIEDLDRPRCRPGAADAILRILEAYGLHWDGSVLYQSQRLDRYAEALTVLRQRGLSYPCGCSRKELAVQARLGIDGPLYPGTCRAGLPPGKVARAERLRTDDTPVRVSDRVHGLIVQCLASAVGDFVIRRADGIVAYQLAVVVDDAAQGITQVVRGADLLVSTPRQCYLFDLFGWPRPAYAHLPLARDGQGRKLSKSCAARPVSAEHPLPALCRAWAFLGQTPPPQPPVSVAEFWAFARAAWSLAAVPREAGLPSGRPTGRQSSDVHALGVK